MLAIIRLRKRLYGLPHAPATSRKHSDAALRSRGYTPTVSDPRLYVKINFDGTKVYSAVQVDDLGIAASTKALVKKIVTQIIVIFLPWYAGGQRPRQTDDHDIPARIFRRFAGRIRYYKYQRATYADGVKPREPESETNPRLNTAGIQLPQSKVGSTL